MEPSRQKVFVRFREEEPSPMKAFLDYLMKKRKVPRVRTLLLSHNGGRFDTYLALEEILLRKHLRPKMVTNGMKVYR
jgi:hypothetical protein